MTTPYLMPDQQQTDRPRISLEQLLKLKRSERPDAHFWEGFDRELHRRQLASIVTKPAWHTRLGHVLFVGLRRATPFGAAAVAAVAGFMVLQPKPQTESETAPTVAAKPVAAPVMVAKDETVPLSSPTVAAIIEGPEIYTPSFAPPTTGEPRFVVHEFVASATPTRTFVSVTSPNTFSSPAYDPGAQMVNTLTLGYDRRVATATEAGRF